MFRDQSTTTSKIAKPARGGRLVGWRRQQGPAASCDGAVDWPFELRSASKRLARYLDVTPQVHCQALGAKLKLESLQVTGSYKVRGALNAMLWRQESGDHRPVVCASAGNHAKGAAWAAKRLERRLVVVMPKTAPRVKIDGTRRAGGEIVLIAGDYQAAEEHARGLAQRHDWSFLSAFDEPAVIAGQATVGLEIAQHKGRVKTVVVPVGGGGLAAGVGLALRHSGLSVVGVQVAGLDAMTRLLRGQLPLQNLRESVADGVSVREPGKLTRALCRELIDQLVVVTEAEVREAMRRLAHEAHLVVEGAGAVAVAGLLKGALPDAVAVLSGGNIDPQRFVEVLGETPSKEDVARQAPHGGRPVTTVQGNAAC